MSFDWRRERDRLLLTLVLLVLGINRAGAGGGAGGGGGRPRNRNKYTENKQDCTTFPPDLRLLLPWVKLMVGLLVLVRAESVGDLKGEVRGGSTKFMSDSGRCEGPPMASPPLLPVPALLLGIWAASRRLSWLRQEDGSTWLLSSSSSLLSVETSSMDEVMRSGEGLSGVFLSEARLVSYAPCQLFLRHRDSIIYQGEHRSWHLCMCGSLGGCVTTVTSNSWCKIMGVDVNEERTEVGLVGGVGSDPDLVARSMADLELKSTIRCGYARHSVSLRRARIYVVRQERFVCGCVRKNKMSQIISTQKQSICTQGDFLWVRMPGSIRNFGKGDLVGDGEKVTF